MGMALSSGMGAAIGVPEDQLIDSLQSWLQVHLSRAQSVRVDGVDLPNNGASNLTGIIRARWTDGDVERQERFVLRTISASADQLYETYDLGKQYRIMECLANAEVKVPRLLAYETDTSLLGREFYVMYNTGGQAVPEGPSYHESGWFAELTDDQRGKVWMESIDSIGAIHRLDWQALGLGFVANAAASGDINDQFLARHSDLLHWMERRNDKSYPRLRRIYDWMEANYPRNTPTSMLWADAKLGNVMVENAKVIGILDWEHCTLGPCLYDVANWIIFDRLMSVGIGIPRLTGLPEQNETVRRYEAASGLPGTDIAYFELFSAVRLVNVNYGVAPRLIAAGRVKEGWEHNNTSVTILNNQLESMGLSF
jgi:aminoglycoside phosphotransferase (APT) family kinase protein